MFTPKQDEMTGWADIEKGISKLKAILEGKETSFKPTQYMQLYSTAYDICKNKKSGELYDKYKTTIVDYLNGTVIPALLSDKHDDKRSLMRELALRWKNHNIMVHWMSRFFEYVDRYYVHRRSLPCMKDVGLSCFRDLVYERIKGRVRDDLVSLIHQEREGVEIDRAVVKEVVGIFVRMGMNFYEGDFESAVLTSTAQYYSRKGSDWIVSCSCPEYMIKVEDCLMREKDRVLHYLDNSTEMKLLEKVQHELLVVHGSKLLEKEESGCRALLGNDKVDDLARMFRLFYKVPQGLDPVATMFKEHVTHEGCSLVNMAADHAAAAKNKAEKKDVATAAGSGSTTSHEQVFVWKLIELHKKYLGYALGCFQNHTLFHRALKDAFEAFCYKTVAGSSTAELLASFCDNVLKNKGGVGGGGSTHKMEDGEIEEALEKVVQLLAYVSDKDLFGEFHRKKLCRRLLFSSGSNCFCDEHEKSLLSKLKQQMGGQFTSKMEGMVTNFDLARENQAGFAEYVGSNPSAAAASALSVTVLTTGFWPTYKSSNLKLPEEMARCVEVFNDYYGSMTNNRKLTWNYSLGTVSIIGRFDVKSIEMSMTTYHAAVLLLFNSFDRLSYAEIKRHLSFADEDLVRVLHSLSCSKYRILNKEPATGTAITDADVFVCNCKFTDKARRIRLSLPPLDERKKVIEDVDKNRGYAIDALIVRIMKTRKVMGYQQLVMECIQQLSAKFKPDPRAIKKRVEDLVTRDFLERDAEDPNIYNYVA